MFQFAIRKGVTNKTVREKRKKLHEFEIDMSGERIETV